MAVRHRSARSLRRGRRAARRIAVRGPRRLRAESYVQYAVVVTLALLVGGAVLGLATNFGTLFGRIGQDIVRIGS
jgi:hypothetical protein